MGIRIILLGKNHTPPPFKLNGRSLMKSDLDKVTEIEGVDEAYNKFEEVMVSAINEHAPMKKRKSISHPIPFINKTLRSAVYIKRMTHTKVLKIKVTKIGRHIESKEI